MTRTAPYPHTSLDPLAAFMAGATATGTPRPIPLVATSFDVRIDAGLATVSMQRTFRNEEEESIEATITFPVPVHGVLFDLEARIGDRVLKAQAQGRNDARTTYEDAVETGKTAVLHEEVLRGVHMLSVGHIPAGEELEVAATFAMTLTNVDGTGHLRIPLTVGDIYGRSGLQDSDEMIHGGPNQMAELTVECSEGSVTLLGGNINEGRAKVPLDAPIDLKVEGWTPRDLSGRMADGRDVSLRIEPASGGDDPIFADLVIDHSGSMAEICSFERKDLTKHQAIIEGFQKIAGKLRKSDIIRLWEFDNDLREIGSTSSEGLTGILNNPEKRFLKIVRQLSGPAGGTNIGCALKGVTTGSSAKDVLLVTDGKSYALDVQALAQTGKRFSVVLIGEDSLEANVGHLAALTGGDLFVAAGADVAKFLDSALMAFRENSELRTRKNKTTDKIESLDVRRAGMNLAASWKEADKASTETTEARSVAALAASLAMPLLDKGAATILAEAEGLVTHLTSLVLVDEARALQEGIPGTRKVSLPSPRAGMAAFADIDMASARVSMPLMNGCSMPDRADRSESRYAQNLEWTQDLSQPTSQDPNWPVFSSFGAQIDWDLAPQELQSGNLSSLDQDTANAIRKIAMHGRIKTLAENFDLDPIALVVALMAIAEASKNRSAARIAKFILLALSELDVSYMTSLMKLDGRT